METVENEIVMNKETIENVKKFMKDKVYVEDNDCVVIASSFGGVSIGRTPDLCAALGALIRNMLKDGVDRDMLKQAIDYAFMSDKELEKEVLKTMKKITKDIEKAMKNIPEQTEE